MAEHQPRNGAVTEGNSRQDVAQRGVHAAAQLDERDQDGLIRDEHAEEDQREDQVGAPKSPFGQDVAVDRADHRGQHSGGHGDGQAVHEVGRELVPGLAEAPEVEACGQCPHAVEGHFVEALEARYQKHVDRDEVVDGGRHE